jgi:hypothetical protein
VPVSPLAARFPGVPISGFFIARRVIPNPLADFDDDVPN